MVTDLSTSPRLYSCMLYERLRTHFRSYMLLWQDGSYLNADIILRAIIETTICLAANASLSDEFVQLVRGDAASSLKELVKIWRAEGLGKLVADGEMNLRNTFGTEPSSNSAQLNWKDLADRSGHPRLYNYHRLLSTASAHITGVSLMRGVAGPNGEDAELASALDRASGSVNFASMASVVALAGRLHAGMLGAMDVLLTLDAVDEKLQGVAREFAPLAS